MKGLFQTLNNLTTLNTLTLNHLAVLHENTPLPSDIDNYFDSTEDIEFEEYSLSKELNRITALELNYKTTTAGELAKAKNDTKKLQLPLEFQPYAALFDEKKAQRFPSLRPYDHKIDLKDSFKPLSAKV